MIPQLPPYNPRKQASWFGLFRFRSPLLTESSFLYIPSGTEMFHFPEFASYTLCIQVQIPSLQLGGLPHSDIPGSQFVCNSPGLFAACHVLHRLPMPRHPPHALNSLTRLFVSSARILKASCLIRSLCSKLLFKLSKNTNFTWTAASLPRSKRAALLLSAVHKLALL